jgi:hypothetical protein
MIIDSDNMMIAACGLICRDCAIRKVPFESEAAEEVVSWLRTMEWLKEDEGVPEILERKMYCKGCHGDRSLHWLPECWILVCCVDEKMLDNCSQCQVFPCDRLVSWSQEREAYGEALQLLHSLTDADAD